MWRLELTTMTHYTVALRLYEACGFKVEGLRRSSVCVDGEFVDEYYMGLGLRGCGHRAKDQRAALESPHLAGDQAHTGATRKAARAKAAEVLDCVGVPDAARAYPHEFSGGQRQRVGIARALALRPRLLVCDEPVTSLDVPTQAQVLELLANLQAEFDLTVVFVSHDLAVVRQVSDRVVVMRDGRIVELAATDTVFDSLRHPYTRALLSAVPLLHPA